MFACRRVSFSSYHAYALLAAFWILELPRPARAETTYQVGVARVDITPEGPIRLNGFGFRRDESDGVTQPIYAKALAIGSNQEGPALLITVDILGIPADIAAEVADRLRAKAHIAPERIAICATHTHTGPMLKGANTTLFGVPIPAEHLEHIDRYTRVFVDKLEQVALDALADRRPATLAWTIGSVGFAQNRRTAGGPVDHDLPILVVRERVVKEPVVKDADGKIRAIYTSYACHCVTLSNNKISGDWAGFAQQLIERSFPGAVALVSVGCGADSNPNSGVTGDKADVATAQGAEIADEVKRLIKTPMQPLSGELKIDLAHVSLPFDEPPSREGWEAKVKQGGAVGYHAGVQLARLDHGEKLRTEIDYPVQTWAFGDQLAMTFLPGEVVVDYSLRLKRELDGLRLWVNAYANAAPCYIPSERVLKEGGYEGADAMIYYDQPTRFRGGLEQIIIDAVRKQLVGAFPPAFNPDGTNATRPLAPQAARNTLHARPGLAVELVAAEPLVESPVAIAFGADGRLWVAEMVDYPTGLDGQFAPGGRVRVLVDTDGDGRYDKSTIFLDGIPFPTGITVWRSGVLVCAAPDILYAEDTDGDGRADVVRKLYSGFGTENYQARVNSLEYGLDGWVYGSCGLFGGEITSFSGEKLALGDRDFRIKPDTGDIEPATGRTQQGRVRDDWGNWFGCENSTLLQHYVLEDHYLARNLHVAPPNPTVYVPDYPDSTRLYSIGPPTLFKLSGPPNQVTAGCGLGIYRDDLLGGEVLGNSFTCEPVNHLVHRLVLSPRGVTFSGRRAADETQSEFLASTDTWFRPVQARTGPDGALWVVDMYRYLIEHPRWVPPDDLAKIDVRAGHSLGRIYRVVPRDRPPRPIVRLDRLNTAGLVAALDSPNGPQRDLAGQMLVWKNDPAAVRPLAELVRDSSRAVTRMQALCTLDALGARQAETAAADAADDTDAGVRRHAIRILEKISTSVSGLSALRDRKRLVGSADASNRMVQLQAACSLGVVRTPEAAAALVKLAERGDPYLSAAVLSSIDERNLGAVLDVAFETKWRGDEQVRFWGELLRLAGAIGEPDTIDRALARVSDSKKGDSAVVRYGSAAGLLDALEQRRGPLTKESEERLRDFLARARRMAGDVQAPHAPRCAAISLLGRMSRDHDADLTELRALVTPQQPAAVQEAAVATLARIARDESADLLLAGWAGYTPPVRSAALDALMAREAWLARLVEKMEQGKVQAAQIDAARLQRLLEQPNRELAARVQKLVATTNADRQAVLADYQVALSMPGDRERGKAAFAKRCALCHRVDEVGHAVGPDIALYRAKPPQALLVAVLDPNQAVDNRYISYTAVLNDGRILSGVLANETAGSITLAGEEGKQVVILRSDLDELRASGKSLMPEGLERDLSKQDLADLIAFLGGGAQAAKQFDGNQPRVVRAEVDGSLSLPATSAEIYGDQIVFESEFRNIGFWHGQGDYATWRIDLEREGSFDVELDWACHPDSAGNAFVLEGAEPALEGTIASTGGWDQYRQTRIGTVTIKAGTSRLTLRPSRPLRGALADVRGLRLTPAASGAKSNEK